MRKLDRGYWLLLVVAVFFGKISYAFFLLVKRVGLHDVTVILVCVLFNGLFVLTTIPASSLSDRIGRAPMIAMAFGLFILTCATMALAAILFLLMVGLAHFGLC